MEGVKPEPLNIKGMDDVIRHLGNPGRFQTLVFILIACNYFPVVFHHVSMAFYGYRPPYQCQPKHAFHSDVILNQAASAESSYNATSAEARDHVIFRGCDVLVTSESGVNHSELCQAGEFRYLLPEGETTVVMEWDLVCERAYFTHLATTVYYCGVMLGGFACGYFSDYFGRRPVILATLGGATLVGTGLAFVQEFPMFLALRFVLGFLTQGLHTASFIMAIELFPMQQRTMAGCVIQLFWGGAVLALGGVAWLLKDWRMIQLAISVPSVLAVSYFWLIPESLRWLLAKEKHRKAERMIKRIASFNKLNSPLRKHPEMATWALLRQHNNISDNNHNTKTSIPLSMEDVGKKEEKKAAGGSVKDLFSTTLMLKRSMILFYIWFAGNVSYFGLTFMSTSLAGNRFLNYSLSGCVEFLAYAINTFVIRRFGRRNPLCVYYCLTTISCLGVGLIPPLTASGVDLRPLITAFSVLGKFAAGGSFSCFELLTVEMYPTVLRNVGTGLCGFWGRLGAVMAPQCLNLGLYTFSQLPAILIGALTLLGGLVTLLLPDTSHTELPDTVYEITVSVECILDDEERVKDKRRGCDCNAAAATATSTAASVAAAATAAATAGASDPLLAASERVSSV